MRSAACSPSSSSAPPPPPSCASGVDAVTVDALLRAAMEGDLELVARMAAQLKSGPGAGGVVWSSCGATALQLAAANGRAHVSHLLVDDLSIPVDSRSSSGDTPLLLAATFSHIATAACLLERGADPSAQDSDCHTPLHWAAFNGDRELAMLLLQKGAEAGAASPEGTPLQVAATRAHPDVVAILLGHGADPNKVANIVFTPLVSSISGGSLECMKLLIQAGANVNADGSSGTTPLFLACSRHGRVPFVKCLLDAGANPNLTDELGRLPVEVAAAYAETEVVQLLFPVTRRAPTLLAWSVAGLLRYVNSDAYADWLIKASRMRKDELKQQGCSAFGRKDYDGAILLYSRALKLDVSDADLYSNRSVCWLRIGVGEQALADAQACTRMQPDCSKGYYLQGMALRLLQDHASAFHILLKARKLDPVDADIKKALRAILKCFQHQNSLELSQMLRVQFV